MLVTDERLGRAVRRGRRPSAVPRLDPVGWVVVEELAAAASRHAAALREAGATFLEAVGATGGHGVSLGLRTAIAGLAAMERVGDDPAADLRRQTDGDPLLAMLVAALVRHRPGEGGPRPAAEARAVAGMLSKLVYMFRAQSEAAVLTEVVG